MPAKPKRKKPIPATRLTLIECRRRGWICDIVERKIPRCFITKDLFGCIDIIAVEPGKPGTIGVQSTVNNGGQHTKHHAKILAESRALEWLRAGNRLLLWSWAKQGARGKRKLWTLREEEILVGDWQRLRAVEAIADRALAPATTTEAA